jgi:DNA-binding transcriptional LysR family regulator
MNLIWLEDFLALAATGNFSRAAEDRHSSQPAFSRRIRALEEWVGADLFDRSSQPAQLTEVGKWFVEVAQELIARVSRIPGDAKRVAQASSLTLRVASTHVLSFTFLPRWLRGLESTAMTLGPVELMSDVLQRCEALMMESKVHFVLTHSHPGARGALDRKPFTSALVGQDVLIAVSAPGKDGRPRHPLTRRAKSAVALLKYTSESGLGRIVHAVVEPRLSPLPVEIVFKAHLASVLRTMVLDGRGVAWLPRTLVDEDLATGLVVPAADREWDIPDVPLEIRLYRDAPLLGKAAEEFWSSVAGHGPRA